jgi:hypothetical protein
MPKVVPAASNGRLFAAMASLAICSPPIQNRYFGHSKIDKRDQTGQDGERRSGQQQLHRKCTIKNPSSYLVTGFGVA